MSDLPPIKDESPVSVPLNSAESPVQSAPTMPSMAPPSVPNSAPAPAATAVGPPIPSIYSASSTALPPAASSAAMVPPHFTPSFPLKTELPDTPLSDPPEETEETEEPEEAEEHEDNEAAPPPLPFPDEPQFHYRNLYHQYKHEFKLAHQKSSELFNLEKAQRQTLYFFQRRNNALLRILEEYNKADSHVDLETDGFDPERIIHIAQTAPRLGRLLKPVLDLQKGNDIEVDKNHLINLFVSETVPELINDDLSAIETNPQDADSWCRRNVPNLVTTKFRPIKLPAKGLVNDYQGSELVLNFPEDENKEEEETGKKRKAVAEPAKKKAKK